MEHISNLTLSHFRSHKVSKLSLDGRPVVIFGKNGTGKTIGLRADMDALPIFEENQNKKYKSKCDGKMHACGHDGHTAMLLGAAKYLSETKNFKGKVGQ